MARTRKLSYGRSAKEIPGGFGKTRAWGELTTIAEVRRESIVARGKVTKENAQPVPIPERITSQIGKSRYA